MVQATPYVRDKARNDVKQGEDLCHPKNSNIMEATIVYWGNIRIMEKKMEITITWLYRDYRVFIGVIWG